MVSLGVVFCRCSDSDFYKCQDMAMIRAIGNITPDFPNEKLYIKSCRLIQHSLGECENQTLLDKLPRLPIFFYKEKKYD